jgi:hypothetical protein
LQLRDQILSVSVAAAAASTIWLVLGGIGNLVAASRTLVQLAEMAAVA